ncbi:sigma-70 family RNA polymerase sigma factor [Aggregicoccus sp. 17bor-14]|uniref:RNA polymerase sigma factor n=1 Tax=Myxococcaceae TaxID=31 RepID=UPI00129CF6F5|nr:MULTISPECIES: sigma-70 family RNA polymerase sigma factor [Myxococcaceae]MBF5045202.1 sigma-70 family RNA polymerase sigma factor [Simulacricoccus sp. 17bor-14]MRI90943.1 sigma-70 family RNA polymerase sigma factor [Aggregicoccus sp. 17bor-14]
MTTLALAADPDVLAAAGGDRGAYGRLVGRYQGLVCALCLTLVRDVAASEDLAQDVFLAAWRGLPRLRSPDSFLPWLKQLTRHRARTYVSTRTRAPQLLEDEATREALVASLADPKPHPGEAALQAEERRLLLEVLDTLPEEARELVTLFYREGRSVAQVAALLELSEEAVRQRLSRARARLRAGLLERFGELLGRTAPDARFSAGVLAALPIAGPGGGVAAGLGLKAAGAKLSGAALGGALLGLAGGLAGVFFGRRQALNAARDEGERRGVRRLSAFGAALCTAFVLLTMLAVHLHWPRLALAAVYAGFLGLMGWTYGVAFPRLVAPRLEAELREDPEGAPARHARARLCSRWGLWGGMALATMAMAWSLWHYPY